ncbi:hypothetical protein OBBRIDRAFT_825861 [Obba rivulosa]|uniref:Uncharacterized protein n=1 Tax=Obba rivulosa TaxID=1052685 RepID=A0A8E2B1Q2_9APHY|nr:hypothetical protein OBBRIDRAFT_825861 [Obba rivulosa]
MLRLATIMGYGGWLTGSPVLRRANNILEVLLAAGGMTQCQGKECSLSDGSMVPEDSLVLERRHADMSTKLISRLHHACNRRTRPRRGRLVGSCSNSRQHDASR